MEVTFSSLVSKSWASFKTQWTLAVGMTVVVFAVSAMIGRLAGLGWLLTAPLNIGWLRCLIKISDGQKAEFEDLAWPYTTLERFIHSLLVTVIFALGVAVGTIFLVLPGIWFAVAASLGTYYVALGEPNSLNAIKRSLAAVKGRWWTMFGIFLGCIGIIILGVLCLGVGFFVASPLVGLILVNLARAWDRGPVVKSVVT